MDPGKCPIQAGFQEGLDWPTRAPEGLGFQQQFVWTRDNVPISEALVGNINICSSEELFFLSGQTE
eukprot:7992524-Pyramimonas_sp.AAC.1